MTRTVQILLSKAFPVIALSGLLLAAWALIVEPGVRQRADETRPSDPTAVYAQLGVQ